MPLYAPSIEAGLADPAWTAEYRRLYNELALENQRNGGAYTIDPRNRGTLDNWANAETRAWRDSQLPGGYSMIGGIPQATPQDHDLYLRFTEYQRMMKSYGMPGPDYQDPGVVQLYAEWAAFGNKNVSMNEDGYYNVPPPPGITPVQALSQQVGDYADKASLFDQAAQAAAFAIIGAGIAGAGAAAFDAATGAAGAGAGEGAGAVVGESTIPQYIAAPAWESSIPEYIAAGTQPALSGLDAVLAVDAGAGLGASTSAASAWFSEALDQGASYVVKTGETLATKKLTQALAPKPNAPAPAKSSGNFTINAAPQSAPSFFDELVALFGQLVASLENLLGVNHGPA